MMIGRETGVSKVVIAIILVVLATAGLGIYKAGAPKRALEAKQMAEQAEEQRLSLIDEANCSKVAVDAADAKIKSTLVLFQDAAALASSTSRVALAVPVASLQQIKRDLTVLVVPKCMENGKKNMVLAMEYHIEAFLKFMQNSESKFTNSVRLYSEHMLMATSELIYIRKCAPRCREEWTGVVEANVTQANTTETTQINPVQRKVEQDGILQSAKDEEAALMKIAMAQRAATEREMKRLKDLEAEENDWKSFYVKSTKCQADFTGECANEYAQKKKEFEMYKAKKATSR
jgi:hypothetical protein